MSTDLLQIPGRRIGKATPRFDRRTLRYADLRAPGPWRGTPAWDWDVDNPGVPRPMFLNDQLGCCVVSGSAHFILRAEKEETGVVPSIADAEIRSQYFLETGGPDDGLVVLDHLKLWRNQGLRLGGKVYRIHSFLAVDPRNPDEVREASLVGLGLCYGLNLSRSDASLNAQGKTWVPVAGPDGRPGSWGGHYVGAFAYDAPSQKCVTWGDYQRWSNEWLWERCDECYLLIDAPDGAALDVPALESALAHV